jgi:hypothetical protein
MHGERGCRGEAWYGGYRMDAPRQLAWSVQAAQDAPPARARPQPARAGVAPAHAAAEAVRRRECWMGQRHCAAAAGRTLLAYAGAARAANRGHCRTSQSRQRMPGCRGGRIVQGPGTRVSLRAAARQPVWLPAARRCRARRMRHPDTQAPAGSRRGSVHGSSGESRRGWSAQHARAHLRVRNRPTLHHASQSLHLLDHATHERELLLQLVAV